jgi:hypothetical protein
VNDYWQPIKTWTTIALTISQNGLALSGTAIAVLIALVLYRLVLMQQEKNMRTILFDKLPIHKQQLIQAIAGARKEGNSTTQAIADRLSKQTGTPLSTEQLAPEIQEAEKIGLIEKSLINMGDKPGYIWNSLVCEGSFASSLPFISRFFKGFKTH